MNCGRTPSTDKIFSSVQTTLGGGGGGGTQPPIQWVLGDLSLGLKQLDREADHSSPSSTRFENEWSYVIPIPPLCLHRVHRDTFTITLFLY
jgi:hypothetical protein